MIKGKVELKPILFFDAGLPVIVWNQVSSIESVDHEKKEVTLNTPVVTPSKSYTDTIFPFDKCFQKVFVKEGLTDNQKEEFQLITNP